MRCPKSRFCIRIIVFDELELIIFVSQGLTLSTASLVLFIILVSLALYSKLTDDPSAHPPVTLVDEDILEVTVGLLGEPLLGHAELLAGAKQAHLGRVLVKHHGVEFPALVVADQVVSGVARLDHAAPDVFVLLQGLVQGKDDLAVGEAIQEQALLLHPLHGANLLLLLLGRLSKVQVQHGDSPENHKCNKMLTHKYDQMFTSTRCHWQ